MRYEGTVPVLPAEERSFSTSGKAQLPFRIRIRRSLHITERGRSAPDIVFEYNYCLRHHFIFIHNEMIKKQDIAPSENGLPRYNLSDERTSSPIPVITKRTGDQENYETEKN